MNVLRNDPCRTRSAGLTIEDTQATLWYTDREVVALSPPIDFIEVCILLVYANAVTHPYFCCSETDQASQFDGQTLRRYQGKTRI